MAGTGLIIAILGALDLPSARLLVAARRRGTNGIAFVARTSGDWDPHGSGPATRPGRRALLQSAGWRVVTVQRGDSLAVAWSRACAGSAAYQRSADRQVALPVRTIGEPMTITLPAASSRPDQPAPAGPPRATRPGAPAGAARPAGAADLSGADPDRRAGGAGRDHRHPADDQSAAAGSGPTVEVVLVIWLVGVGARLARVPAAAAVLLQVAGAAVALTALFTVGGIGGVIPNGAVVGEAGDLLAGAWDQIRTRCRPRRPPPSWPS